jgi:hypothetical protein
MRHGAKALWVRCSKTEEFLPIEPTITGLRKTSVVSLDILMDWSSRASRTEEDELKFSIVV